MTSKRPISRILHIEKPTYVGGSVISLYELVRGLNKDLFESVVLFYGPHPFQKKFRALGVQVIVLNEKTRDSVSRTTSSHDFAASLSTYSSWLATGYRTAKKMYLISRKEWPLARRVARIIKNESVDLVHHNNSLAVNQATVLAARFSDTPQVCHARMFHNFSFYENSLVRSIDRFVYISRAVAQQYKDSGIPVDKGQVVANPIDAEAFSNASQSSEIWATFGLTEQDTVISNVGRLDWWKGQDYFLRALARVIKTHPHFRIKALLVGDKIDTAQNLTFYQGLQKLVRELDLTEHVIFTGFRSDISQIMLASDIIVHSASEPEPFGRVIVEGMAAGKPVIATKAGGVLDIIDDQVTGLLIPPKNVKAMADAINGLIQDRQLAISLGRRARREVKERFSVKQHVVSIEKLYREILETRR